MPLPTTSLFIAEIQAAGIATAKGSNDKNSLSVFHFRRGSAGATLSEANVEAAFQTAIMLPITNLLNNRYAQTFNTVRMIEDAERLSLQVTRAVAGQIAGDSMPMHMAAMTLARTQFRGRRFLGKKHLFPLSEADTTGATADLLNAGALALHATFNAAWLAGFTDSDGNVWLPIILSRKNSQLKTNPTTVVFSNVTSILTNKRVGRMRKREVKSVY